MHIILKDFKGSPDGYTVVEYKKDQELELPESLAEVAIKEKWAKVKPAKAAKPPVEAKPPVDQKAELQTRIADLELALAGAVGGDRAAIETELAAAQAALAELG